MSGRAWLRALLISVSAVGVAGWPALASAQVGSARPEVDDVQALERRCGVRVVSRGALEEAMRGLGGYDLTATPNGGRFLAELLLELARRYRDRRPDGPPFLIRQGEFFPAYLSVTGLAPEEAPPTYRKGYELGQKIVVEYRTDRVVERVVEGPGPRQALSVRAAWPDTGGLPSSFTYEDTASVPEVRLREEREITYRLLEFLAVVAYDEMEGIAGRPTTGPLGLLFDVIGMADIRESRFVMAGGGEQVTFTRVHKVVSQGAVATVDAEGRAVQGIPEESPEYERLRELVQRDFEIEYAAEPPPLCPRAREDGRETARPRRDPGPPAERDPGPRAERDPGPAVRWHRP